MVPQRALQQVLAFFKEQFPDASADLNASSNLQKTILLDSLATMEVIMFIEEAFGVSLERADLDHFETPQTIADLIERKQTLR